MNNDSRVTEIRRRWREGALKSKQETLKERNEEAMEVLRNFSDIFTVIKAFRSLGEFQKYTNSYYTPCSLLSIASGVLRSEFS